jgi:hypothetical protein
MTSSADLRIERYQPNRHAVWDGFVRSSRNGHFMLQRGYMDYHADRFADESLLFLRGDDLVAVLPAHRCDRTLASHEGLPFAGLVVGSRTLHRDVRAALELLGAYMRANSLVYFTYRPTPACYHSAPFEDDIYALYDLGARCTGMKLSAGFPGVAPPYQSAQTAHELRRMARKYPCLFRETTDVAEFWTPLERFLCECHGVRPVHSAGEMALLKSRFPGHIRMVLAEAGGEVIAGLLIYLTDRVQRAQYLFRRDDGRARISARLHLHVATHPDYQRAWHDFGTSASPLTGELDEGVLLNKEITGARGTIVQTWTWEPASAGR